MNRDCQTTAVSPIAMFTEVNTLPGAGVETNPEFFNQAATDSALFNSSRTMRRKASSNSSRSTA